MFLEELFDVGWRKAPHRVLRNKTVETWEAAGRPPSGARPGEVEVIARSRSVGEIVRYQCDTPRTDFEGDIDALSLWAGQSVEVGESGHHHTPLDGVLDLRGKTDLRQLIRLVYHSQGVLGPVSLLMHLAAAVEVKPGRPKNRPCVVLAGGREPPHWEAYPHHQFIHNVGALQCCDNGGCWKSRTIPLGDGDEKDLPENLCVDVIGRLPRCMDMITPEEVIRRIELYFDGGAISYLSAAEWRVAENALLACAAEPC